MQKTSTKKYKTRHSWVRKVIHWELYKKLKFDHKTKYYMHKLESIPEIFRYKQNT